MSHARSIVVVTGMSGAGRSTALDVLEDVGFYVVDNLPTPLLAQTVALFADDARHARLGLGMDVRVRAFLDGVDDEIDRLKARGEPFTVLFMDAEDAVLVRRYSESRRPHPLSVELAGASLHELITAERERLLDLRRRADRTIDTTRLTTHALRRTLTDLFAEGHSPMTTRVVSFGYKHGIPLEADLVFDVRYLANPHFVPELRPFTGRDPAVADYVLGQPEAQELLDHLSRFIAPLLPRYAREGKVVLTVAIGCTGGRHRSVALAEALSRRLSAGDPPGDVLVAHRDADRGE